ncbi:MAG: hypothetical protein JO235_08435 [Chroococcidiopsidaceae cyanobacterium CP_BM_RX_35]|nr:hypothetical protein [Chroococcidiopsidaceae cyanobacterium CP_BM_RX_35]
MTGGGVDESAGVSGGSSDGVPGAAIALLLLSQNIAPMDTNIFQIGKLNGFSDIENLNVKNY